MFQGTMLLLAAAVLVLFASTIVAYDNGAKATTAKIPVNQYKAATGSDINKKSDSLPSVTSTQTTKKYSVPTQSTSAVKGVKKQGVEPYSRAILSLATIIRDEVVDIFDAVAHAESNEERFENIVDIAIRHRGILGTAVLGMAIKTAVSPEVGYQTGSVARANFRQAEMAKWGSRMAK